MPTEQRRAAEAGRARRLWGYAAGAGGALLAGLSTALFLVNQDRYGDWQKDERVFTSKLRSGDRSAADAASLHQEAADIQRVDDVAFGTALLSGALFAASVGLLLDSGAPVHQ